MTIAEPDRPVEERLVGALNRLAAAVESVAAMATVPELVDCERCAGAGSFAPGVPCPACGGSRQAPKED